MLGVIQGYMKIRAEFYSSRAGDALTDLQDKPAAPKLELETRNLNQITISNVDGSSQVDASNLIGSVCEVQSWYGRVWRRSVRS